MSASLALQAQVPIFHLSTKEEFHSTVYPARRPAILRGIDLGRAPGLWTPDYLCQHCGSQPVKVHVCPVAQMDFINKNFAYKYALSCSFAYTALPPHMTS